MRPNFLELAASRRGARSIGGASGRIGGIGAASNLRTLRYYHAYLMRDFAIRSPFFNLAASQRGLRPRPVQVSFASSGFAYLAATLRPLPPRPPKRSDILKPAAATMASTLSLRSVRV